MAKKALPVVPAWQQMAADANDFAADAERQLRSAVDSARAAGDLLLQIRKQIGHGGWTEWLKQHWNHSDRVAQKYMQIAVSWSLIADKSPKSINHALQLLVEETGAGKPKQPKQTISKSEANQKQQAPAIPEELEPVTDVIYVDDLDDKPEHVAEVDPFRPEPDQVVRFKPDPIPAQLMEPVVHGVRHRSEVSLMVDDFWLKLEPAGPMGVIAAIRELVETFAQKWPDRRGQLSGQLTVIRQDLVEGM
jgi:hypothetical protein